MSKSTSSQAAPPTFIGYSESAQKNGQSLCLIEQLIHSLDEFEQFYGGPATTAITVQLDTNNRLEGYSIRNNFLLYDSIKQFFLKGGSSAYIISVGGYTEAIKAGNSEYGLRAGLAALQSREKASLLLMPDAVSIVDISNEAESFQALQQTILSFCTEQKNLTALLDQQEEPSNWVKLAFSKPLKLRDITFTKAGSAVSLHIITSDVETAEALDELEEAIDNAKRIAKSIKRRQQNACSLNERFQLLLADYLAHPVTQKENRPLHLLLQFLKGQAEMINNWICACTLDEVLAGNMLDIIRQTIIPDIATQGLPDLIELHQQAVKLGLVDMPVTGYQEMFCLSSCMGNRCPWQQTNEPNTSITLSNNPYENKANLVSVYEHFEDAINVIIELTDQFEREAQQSLLALSTELQTLLLTVQQSRYIPPSCQVAAKMINDVLPKK